MLFYTPEFFIFFAIFLALLPFFKGVIRTIFCCLVSLIFYSWWNVSYLPLLLFLAVYTYLGSLLVHKYHNKMFFTAIVVTCALPLIYFKYSDFILENIFLFFHMDAPPPVAKDLPLGISFVTFTALAYLADIYRNKFVPEKNFWRTGLYITFFPHLIAGPIFRAAELMPQLAGLKTNKTALKTAMFLFTVGMVKKVLFANLIAPRVDAVYSGAVGDLPHSLLAFYGFSIQIYCDFSGYTDMAIALAMLLGVEFPVNFDRPYASRGIRDFWRRWHITLSRWLRDYIYIPLGGSRQNLFKTVVSLLLTMAIGGLWHGAAWNFVLWGLFHGVLISLEHVLDKLGRIVSAVPAALKVCVTFHVVCIGWVFFRSSTLSKAWQIFHGFTRSGDLSFWADNSLVIALAVLALALHHWDCLAQVRRASQRIPTAVLAPVCLSAMLVCAVLSLDNPATFIYFDF